MNAYKLSVRSKVLVLSIVHDLFCNDASKTVANENYWSWIFLQRCELHVSSAICNDFYTPVCVAICTRKFSALFLSVPV
jgi:hypothetical protein